MKIKDKLGDKKRIGTTVLASVALTGCGSHVNRHSGESPNNKSVPEHIEQKPSDAAVNTATIKQEGQQSQDKTQQILGLLTAFADFDASLAPADENDKTVRDVIEDERNVNSMDLDLAHGSNMETYRMEAHNFSKKDITNALLSGNRAVFIWAISVPGESSDNLEKTFRYNYGITPLLSAESPVTPGTILGLDIDRSRAQDQYNPSSGQ